MTNRALIAGGAGVALLAVVVVAGAAVTGSQAKKALQAAPEAWPMVKVVDQTYNQGLFSSTQTLTLQFGCAAAGPAASAPPTVMLRQRVEHGPLPGFASIGAAVIHTELVLPDSARKTATELFGDKPPLSARTTVGFGGATHSLITMPAFELKGPKGEQFVFKGLQANVRNSGSALHYEMSMPGLDITGQDDKGAAAQMKLAGLRAQGEASGTGSPWIRPGKGEAEIASLAFSAVSPASAGVPPVAFTLNQLKLVSDTTLAQDLLSGTTRITGQGTVGSVKLDKIELQGSVKRLHAPTYEKLVKRLVDGGGACDPQVAAAPQLLMSQLQQDLASLLPFGPEYALDKLLLEIDGKRGELSYSVGVAGVTAAELQAPLPALLMSKGRIKGQAKLPVVWIEQTLANFGGPPQKDPAAQAEMTNLMLAKLTGEGYAVRDGEMLSSQLSFENGVLLVNGKPLGRPPQ